MAYKAPGKHFRVGLSARKFFERFPSEYAAEKWFIEKRWPNGICCPECGSLNVLTTAKHKTMPLRCREKECGKHFSTKTGTFMQSSKIGYQDWLYAIYLVATNLKGVSSMKLHRELEITQKSAWHLAHRIRRAWKDGADIPFLGPVEADETYVGGIRKNMNKSKRKELDGRGVKGKVAVAGVKDRRTHRVVAKVVEDTTAETLQGFVLGKTVPGASVYTDDSTAYTTLPDHESVKHSVGEYVRGQIHTNGVESFWATLKRAHKGTFHRISPKHLNRYVQEFAGRHNMRNFDTLVQMALIAKKMRNGPLRYKDLVS